MARLHFPGKPGQRVGRIRFLYQTDTPTNSVDYSSNTTIVCDGLKLFKDIFGESEEDDFEGFSIHDVRKSKDDLDLKLIEQKGSRDGYTVCKSESSSSNNVVQCSASHVDNSQRCESEPPVSKITTTSQLCVRTGSIRSGMRYVVRRSYAELNKHGFLKSSVIGKNTSRASSCSTTLRNSGKLECSVTDSEPKHSNIELQKLSPSQNSSIIDQSHAKENSSYKCKESATNSRMLMNGKECGIDGKELRSHRQSRIARKLLDKAKKKGIQTQELANKVQSPEKMPVSCSLPQRRLRSGSLRRAFALPARSIRSSRIIIPKKRFMEDFDFSLAYSEKKPRCDQGSTSTSSETALPSYCDQKVAAFDQPLIVEGKRPWKPTLKVQMKMCEDNVGQKSLWENTDDHNSDDTSSAREKMKKDISKYAETMVRKAAGSCRKSGKAAVRGKVANVGGLSVNTPRIESPHVNSEGPTQLSDKCDYVKSDQLNDKVVAKIERILRSQWEGRLRWSNSESNPATASNMNVVSNEHVPTAQQKASVQRQSKNILRKARLQLNKRTLMKLRQPSSLRKLSEQFQKDQRYIQSPIKLHRFPVVQLEPVDPRVTTVVVPSVSTTVNDFSNEAGNASQIAAVGENEEPTVGNETLPEANNLDSEALPVTESPTSDISMPLTSVPSASQLLSGNSSPPTASKAPLPTHFPCSPTSKPSVISSVTRTPNLQINSGERRGPRIKHVCRRAAVVLGYPRAKFLTPPSFSKPDELLEQPKKAKNSKRKQNQGAVSQKVIVDGSYLDTHLTVDLPFSPKQDKVASTRIRKVRCRQCPGCLAQDCGKCVYCLDREKYGGKGTLKKACKDRQCKNLQLPAHRLGKKAGFSYTSRNAKKHVKSSSKTSDRSNSNDNYVSSLSDCDEAAMNAGKDCGSPCFSASQNATLPTSTSGVGPPHIVAGNSGKDCVIGKCFSSLAKVNGRKKVKAHISHRVFVPRPLKHKEKEKYYSAISKPSYQKIENLGQTGISCRSRLPQFLMNLKTNSCQDSSLMKADFWEKYDPDEIWNYGMALVGSSPFTLRASCYLCGSAGLEELIYCALCCEAFHPFCLSPEDIPHKENLENWCCRHCEYCNVCGQQGLLLKCNKCQITYHAACLGPNYPSKPSKRKKIWVCSRCVKCRSCGATSPGSSSSAQWMYDFSFCADCGKLMEKGNFCPICKKCYEDDDYESEMVQCSKCMAWVHSKCDNMTDEMYQILSHLPESVVYTCSCCSIESPASWLVAIKAEIQAGLQLILSSLMNSRCARFLGIIKDQSYSCSPKVNKTLYATERNEYKSCNAKIKEHNVGIATEETIDRHNSITSDISPSLLSPNSDVRSSDCDNDASDFATPLRVEIGFPCDVQATYNSPSIVTPTTFEEKKNFKDEDPCDIMEVKRKLHENKYILVAEFYEDMARIFKSRENKVKKRNLRAARSIFVKNVLKAFPWFKLDDCDTVLPDAVTPPYMDHYYAQYLSKRLPVLRQPSLIKSRVISGQQHSQSSSKVDERMCVLCSVLGDDEPEKRGRLLYCGQDDWIHLNCALWSAEVFEEVDGSLQHVHSAISRGSKMKCERCGKIGATVGCCVRGCPANYHILCARDDGALFQEDKKVFCRIHSNKIETQMEESSFSVRHTMYVDQENVYPKWSKKNWLCGLESSSLSILVGSMNIESLGEVTGLSDYQEFLVPINYSCSRLYWSTKNPRQRVVYTFRTVLESPIDEEEVGPTIENTTTAHIPTVSGFSDDICEEIQREEAYKMLFSDFTDTINLNGLGAVQNLLSDDYTKNSDSKNQMPEVDAELKSLQDTVETLLQNIVSDIADQDVERLTMMICNDAIGDNNTHNHDAKLVEDVDKSWETSLDTLLPDCSSLQQLPVDGSDTVDEYLECRSSVNRLENDDIVCDLKSFAENISTLVEQEGFFNEMELPKKNSVCNIINSESNERWNGKCAENRGERCLSNGWNSSAALGLKELNALKYKFDSCDINTCKQRGCAGDIRNSGKHKNLNNNSVVLNNKLNYVSNPDVDVKRNGETPSNLKGNAKFSFRMQFNNHVLKFFPLRNGKGVFRQKLKLPCKVKGNGSIHRNTCAPLVDVGQTGSCLTCSPCIPSPWYNDEEVECDDSIEESINTNFNASTTSRNLIIGSQMKRSIPFGHDDPSGTGVSVPPTINEPCSVHSQSMVGNSKSLEQSQHQSTALPPVTQTHSRFAVSNSVCGNTSNIGIIDDLDRVLIPGRDRKGLPLRCPKCKRVYRTEESFRRHVESCDFEIDSSSSEDDGSLENCTEMGNPLLLGNLTTATNDFVVENTLDTTNVNDASVVNSENVTIDTPLDAPVYSVSTPDTSSTHVDLEEPFIPKPPTPQACNYYSKSTLACSNKISVHIPKRILPKVESRHQRQSRRQPAYNGALPSLMGIQVHSTHSSYQHQTQVIQVPSGTFVIPNSQVMQPAPVQTVQHFGNLELSQGQLAPLSVNIPVGHMVAISNMHQPLSIPTMIPTVQQIIPQQTYCQAPQEVPLVQSVVHMTNTPVPQLPHCVLAHASPAFPSVDVALHSSSLQSHNPFLPGFPITNTQPIIQQPGYHLVNNVLPQEVVQQMTPVESLQQLHLRSVVQHPPSLSTSSPLAPMSRPRNMDAINESLMNSISDIPSVSSGIKVQNASIQTYIDDHESSVDALVNTLNSEVSNAIPYATELTCSAVNAGDFEKPNDVSTATLEREELPVSIPEPSTPSVHCSNSKPLTVSDVDLILDNNIKNSYSKTVKRDSSLGMQSSAKSRKIRIEDSSVDEVINSVVNCVSPAGDSKFVLPSSSRPNEQSFEDGNGPRLSNRAKNLGSSPHIAFEIMSEDGFHIKSPDVDEAWHAVAEQVQEMRAAARLRHFAVNEIGGLQMFGITHKAVQYLLEQMPGARQCKNFNFRYHKQEFPEEVPENPTGCARAEPFKARKEYDLFNFLASRHRKPPIYQPTQEEEEIQHKSSRRATSMDLPMAMRFRHLRTTAKEAVGVYRSNIHGRGLFCKRNIDAGEMVMEYAGEVIRSILTDKREKYYESKGIGCYMFRIDDNEVVDATMHGNAARFINHSCDPNCYSKVITVDGKKHIVIFALKKISPGEELTYDYKFPIEDIKIPCTCGTKRCRRYLN